MKRIAVIGAGFRGIGCLKTLLEKGYQVDLFEKNNDVGGVWHPSNNYQGLKIHTPARLNQFLDFPLPEGVNLSERLESRQIYVYLQSYCNHYRLYQHMKFNVHVQKIQYSTNTRKSTLVICPKNGDPCTTQEYDYIVYTSGYCDKHIPQFKGAENFQGSVIHSFDATEGYIKALIAKGKKITILGAGKTATDLVIAFRKLGCDFTWLYRKSYWFYRFTPLQNCLKEIHLVKAGNFLFKMLLLLGFMVSYPFPRLGCWLWRVSNVIDTYGERHSDFKKFHVSFIDDQEFNLLKESNKKYAVIGDIDHFAANGLYLKDKRFIETDAVICCTGSSGTKSMVEIEIDNKKLEVNEIHKAYRASVIPKVPNLIFTAYHHFAMGLCDGELQAQWIANYIENNFDAADLEQQAVAYDIPFFTRLILFDSNDYFLPNYIHMQMDFIKNRELKMTEYIRFLYSFFFGRSALKPLKIHNSSTSRWKINEYFCTPVPEGGKKTKDTKEKIGTKGR